MNSLSGRRAFFPLLFVAMLISQASADEEQSPDTQQTALLPVFQVEGNELFRFKVRFQNTTDKPLKYLGAPKTNYPMGLKLWFYQDGKVVLHDLPHDTILAFPESVRELQPGEYVDVPFAISWLHANSQLGTYEVRMQYEMQAGTSMVNKLGVTPLTIDKPIFWLDIMEPKQSLKD